MARALSINEVIAQNIKTLPLEGKWADAFGSPGWSGVWFVWGAPGSGKTSFLMQLCRELCKYFKGVYDSFEEGVGLTIQRALETHSMGSVNGRLVFAERESIAELDARMNKRMSPHFYVIDSFQYTGLSLKEYFEFVNAHRNKLIIFVSQSEGTKPKGRTAASVLFDASLKIWVEGFRAFSKGRFFGPVGHYDVWPERAEAYWGRKERRESESERVESESESTNQQNRDI